jgi:hypothetical protein
MTFILMVACKDSFYMFADTLSADLENKKFSLKIQKSFFSEKHKIGMCIAGDGTLKPNYDLKAGDENKILYTDHILRKFFESIDLKDGVTIDNFDKELDSFLSSEELKQYKDNFNSKVTYFCGGFRTNKDSKKTTVLRAHFEAEFDDNGTKTKEEYSKERVYNDAEAAYFCNSERVFDIGLDRLDKAEGKPKDLTRKKILEENLDKYLLPYVITRTCMYKNFDSYQYDQCLIVSDVLAFSKVLMNAEVRTIFIRYWDLHQCPVLRQDQIYATQFDLKPVVEFKYAVYASFKESNEAFLAGTEKVYYITNQKLTRIPPPHKALAQKHAKIEIDRKNSSSSDLGI